MSRGNECANVEPVAWNLLNNKTTREQARIKDEKNRIEGIPIWVIRNLKHYNNCFVMKAIYNLIIVNRLVGFKCAYTRCVDGKGWIIEKIREVNE
jgi:hypothetical protein